MANRLVTLGIPGGKYVRRPQGFAFRPPFKIVRLSANTFGTTYDRAASLASVSYATTYYVDGVLGSDSNNGTSTGTPFQSIFKAINGRTGGILVYVKTTDGSGNQIVYDATISWKNAQVTSGNLIVRPWPGDTGRILSSMRYTGLSWTLDSGTVYKATIATLGTVVDTATLNTYGDYTRYALKTSIATVQATAGSYWLSGTTLYVNTLDARAPDSGIIVYNAVNNGRFDSTSAKLWLEKIDFWGGQATWSTPGTGSNIWVHDCSAKYSGANQDGFGVGTNIAAVFYNCIAGSVGRDGFKYNAGTTTGVEINCDARSCGRDTVVGNGSSAHAGCPTIRINSQYRGNSGRNINDIGAAASWLLGCDARDSAVTGGLASNVNYCAGTDGGNDASKMWLDNCTSSGSSWDCEAVNTATVYKKAFTGAATDKVQGTGLITSY